MDDQQPSPSTAQSSSGELTDDFPCARCGYNLRGLTFESRCPECGTPARQSEFGNRLRFADPVWIDKLRLGVSVKLWNILLSGVASLGGALLGGAAGVPPTSLAIVAIITGAIGAWALFLLTAPEPMIAREEDPVTLRSSLRVAVLATLLGAFADGVNLRGGETLLMIAAGVAAIAGFYVIFGELVFLRRFARRMPDPKLARSTTILLWSIVAMYGLLVLGGLIAAIVVGASRVAAALGGAPGGPGAAPAGLSAVLIVGGCAALVAFVAVGIGYLIVLIRFRAAFKHAAEQARTLEQPPV